MEESPFYIKDHEFTTGEEVVPSFPGSPIPGRSLRTTAGRETPGNCIGEKVACGGERGSTSVQVLPLFAARKFLSNESTPHLVALVDVDPPSPDNCLSALDSLFAGDAVPHVHLSHPLEFFPPTSVDLCHV